MTNLVQQKVAKGDKVISLAIGEPSFNTPPEVIEFAHKSMLAGDVHYASSYGLPEARKSIANKVSRKNKIVAETTNTLFCTTKLSVYAALLAIPAKEYEVLIPDPGYFYSQPAILAGASPVHYRLNRDFSLDLSEIKRKTTNKMKGIIINSPSNPTGKVFSREELEELFGYCREKGIFIISDEAYEDLVYEKNHFSVGSLEDKPNLVISLFSLSKSYAMTGWRSGYVVASEKIIQYINKFLENTFTCFPPFIQKASAFALDNCDNRIREFRTELAIRRKLVQEEVRNISSLSMEPIEGAFYAFPRYDTKTSSSEVSAQLLKGYNVAVLAGSSFGPSGEGHIRISFAANPESITQGMKEIGRFFKSPS
jgi:aspartate aminotransferase